MKQIAYLLLFFSFSTHAQNADSLRGVWENQSLSDSSRFQALYELIQEVHASKNPDSAIFYSDLLYQEAQAKKEGKYQIRALRAKAKVLKRNGRSYEAIPVYEAAIALCVELEDQKNEANVLSDLGVLYKDIDKLEKGIELNEKALKIREKIQDHEGIGISLNNMGIIYANQGDQATAIQYYSKALKIREANGNTKMIVSTLNNMGILYAMGGDMEMAEKYIRQSLRQSLEAGHQSGIASALNNIGNIHFARGDVDSAIFYFEESAAIKEEIGDYIGLGRSIGNIANAYYRNGQVDKAIEYQYKAVELFKQQSILGDRANSLNNIAAIYSDEGKTSKALELGKEAMQIANESGNLKIISDVAKDVYQYYRDAGQYNQALKTYELYIQSEDSLQSEANQKELIRQQYKYTYEKQAAADSVRAAEEKKVTDAQLAAQEAKLEQEKTQRYALFGGLGLALVFAAFIFNRFRLTSKQKDIIEEQKQIVDQAYDELEEKNTEILDSINYAKRIQSAILPPSKLVKEKLRDSFVLYKPKDIVAGDFYWLEPLKKEEGVLFAAADCTGHGVPGAMVSVICNNGLNRSVREYGLTEPGKILDQTRELVIAEFEKSEEEVKDGMDVALCRLKGTQLQYAGAHNPLWVIRKDSEEVEEIKANKQPIGKFDEPLPYTTHTLELKAGDSFYIFSDGYVDQFGGEKGKKFKSLNLKRLLLSIQKESMEEQMASVDKAFEDWKGDLEQLDDVCVIGVRV